MARYQKIFAGPVSEPLPQVQEANAGAALLPGTFVVMTVASGVRTYNYATAGGTGKVRLLEENYLIGKGPDDAYAAGENSIGLELLDEQLYNVRVPTGVNVALGSPITVGASGKGALAAAGNVILAFAEEAYNNTTGADQLVRVRPARCAPTRPAGGTR